MACPFEAIALIIADPPEMVNDACAGLLLAFGASGG
jgi:hypothetical protein